MLITALLLQAHVNNDVQAFYMAITLTAIFYYRISDYFDKFFNNTSK